MRTIRAALLALMLVSFLASGIPSALAAPATPPLASSEADALAFMREEEKLARDVYQALATTWALPVFTNIASSEQTHMDAIKTLLDRYGLPDPAAGKAPGVFTNPDLQNLYTQLLTRGKASLSEALAVGAAIEEIDILDLQKRITATTPADIARVYTQLRQGSSNHLRAFVTQWEAQTGETYQPQYLDDPTYKAIITSAGPGRNGPGGGNGSGGHGQSGRGRP